MHTLRPGHLRPSVAEAIERNDERRSDSIVWNAFYIGLGLLFAGGLTAGLLHQVHAGREALPPPPIAR